MQSGAVVRNGLVCNFFVFAFGQVMRPLSVAQPSRPLRY